MSNIPPKYITIHASATYPSMNIGVETIRDWHVNGHGWSDVGYHKVIRRDGTIENGRPINKVGAHVLNHNTGNIGICLVGGLKEGTQEPEDNFTDDQYASLSKLLRELHVKFSTAIIVGHNYFEESRGCPCFDWETYVQYLYRAWNSLYLPHDWYKRDWKRGIDKDWNEVNWYKEVPKEW